MITSICTKVCAVLGMLLAGAVSQVEAGGKADHAVIQVHLDKAAQALKNLPYAEEGEGAVIYVIAYSTCPHAKRFEQDWRGKLGNVKMRYVLYGIDERTASEAAELALTRDPADFHDFMAGRKKSPPVRSSNQRIDAFNGIVDALKGGLVPALKANRYTDNIHSPHFFYSDGRRLLTQAGYSKESFADVLRVAQRGHDNASQRKSLPTQPSGDQP